MFHLQLLDLQMKKQLNPWEENYTFHRIYLVFLFKGTDDVIAMGSADSGITFG